MQKPIDKFKRATARRPRVNSTDAEATLWRHLCALHTRGTHFRRQVPIGKYVVDFACMAARLVIEVDGSQHGREPEQARDAARTRWLENEGYRVVRFWNNDIANNIDGVLDTVYQSIYGSGDADAIRLKHLRRRKIHPTPARPARRPSPSRGG